MEFDNNIPIYMQVVENIKKEIVKGNIKLGDKLLSTRDMALEYKINPNTASRIYKELEQQKICFTKRGLGTFITEDKEMVKMLRDNMASKLLEVFLQGMEDLGYTKEELINIIETKYKESDLND